MVNKTLLGNFYSGLEVEALTLGEVSRKVNEGFNIYRLSNYANAVKDNIGLHINSNRLVYNVKGKIFSYVFSHNDSNDNVWLNLAISHPEFWFGDKISETDFEEIMYETQVPGTHFANFNYKRDCVEGYEIEAFDKSLKNFLDRNLPDFYVVSERMRNKSILTMAREGLELFFRPATQMFKE